MDPWNTSFPSSILIAVSSGMSSLTARLATKPSHYFSLVSYNRNVQTECMQITNALYPKIQWDHSEQITVWMNQNWN